MAGYSVENLNEVQNQGENFGINPDELQLRMAKDPLECQNAGISLLRLGPDFRVPFGHKHKTQEEIYVLVSGSARMKVEDEIVEMEPLTAVRVDPGTMRGYEAGSEGADLIVIGAPRTGSGDADTVPGWWNGD
jgi:mannose-6-phosphate isomerase-like protein (cupin superfamily)